MASFYNIAVAPRNLVWRKQGGSIKHSEKEYAHQSGDIGWAQNDKYLTCTYNGQTLKNVIYHSTCQAHSFIELVEHLFTIQYASKNITSYVSFHSILFRFQQMEQNGTVGRALANNPMYGAFVSG